MWRKNIFLAQVLTEQIFFPSGGVFRTCSCSESNSVQLMAPRSYKFALETEKKYYLVAKCTFNKAGGVSGLAACSKRMSVVCVDAAHRPSLQVMLGWVPAAKLTESRKWDTDSSHVGWGSLKCHASGICSSPFWDVQRSCNVSSFSFVTWGADEYSAVVFMIRIQVLKLMRIFRFKDFH